ncbi:hypothetical protein [Bowmanella dokdonensis]|nr:hypothetical protein [Bowmanella dokdonensis]
MWTPDPLSLGIWLRNLIEPGRFLTALHGLLFIMGVKLLMG